MEDKEMAIFVKVFADSQENCKRAELDTIEKTVKLVNEYYNSLINIFI